MSARGKGHYGDATQGSNGEAVDVTQNLFSRSPRGLYSHSPSQDGGDYDGEGKRPGKKTRLFDFQVASHHDHVGHDILGEDGNASQY